MAAFFSVLIPTYNRATLIGKTLDSVFAQTFGDFEVIVVDNCSTDNTEEVLAPYLRTGKLRFIKHDRNYERARSRNTAMDAASGVFATFLDSDDLMYPANLQDARDFAERHPDIKCFHNYYEMVNANGQRIHRYLFPSLKDPRKAIAEGNFLSCIGAFIAKDIYSTYRFDTSTELSGSEDWEFWLRVVADHAVGRIKRVNSGIVDHSARTVRNQELGRISSRIEYIFRKIDNDPHLRRTYGPYRTFMEASRLVFLASAANSSEDYRSARRFLLRAARKSPRFILNYRFLRSLQIAMIHGPQRATSDARS